LLRSYLLPAFEMSQANLDAFVTQIRARRPAMLFGYPSVLAHIAKHAARRGQTLHDVGVRVAFVTSERLYEDQREEISRAFGGRGLPLIKDIQGRTTDFVVAKDGTVMHGLALIYVVRDLPGIAKFKIVQESTDRTRVLLVAGPDFDPRTTERIRAGLAERLGAD